MYEFVTGPLAWVAFIVFFVGITYRVVWYFRGLHWQMDRVAYKPHMKHGIKGAIRSIFYWIVPFGSVGWRSKPFMTILFFVFHIGLVVTPIFLQAHNILLQERWGFSLWTISDPVADTLTVLMILAALFLVLRRIAYPEIRILTTPYDYLLLAISVAPFITGFISYHQYSNYEFWLICHVICGEIMLVAIPFTKLSHFVLFFCSRAQLGMDFGIKRGGMKGSNFSW
jgi:nitrate reductase gamma subunit